MLIARAHTGEFFLGLDAENLRRLKDGKPIVLSLAKYGGHDDVIIMVGETLEDIKSELEHIQGGPLPPESPAPAGH